MPGDISDAVLGGATMTCPSPSRSSTLVLQVSHVLPVTAMFSSLPPRQPDFLQDGQTLLSLPTFLIKDVCCIQ